MNAIDVIEGRRSWAVEQADVMAGLATLPDNSVHCVVTSPPYWGLRDYGTAAWEGGDPDCEHKVRPTVVIATSTLQGSKGTAGHQKEGYRGVCGRCGAVRADAGIGLEATLEEYLARITAVFEEVRRVLRPDGVCWVNMGDAYAAAGGHTGQGETSQRKGRANVEQQNRGQTTVPPGLKPKDLIGMPWRVAFALQDAGWYLRCDVVWHKPNPMPESVTDRPTRSHEYVFLLTKSGRYAYDADAIREEASWQRVNNPDWQYQRAETNEKKGAGNRNAKDGGFTEWRPEHGRNKRSVWTIPTAPFAQAHFATFPPDLVEPCILAGSSERGVCPECGNPWRRVVEVESRPNWRGGAGQKHDGTYYRPNIGGGVGNDARARIELGWEPTCTHGLAPVPAVVMDPFSGAGTTVMVALRHGRRGIGFELNPDYAAMARERIENDAPMFNRPAGKPKEEVGMRPMFDL